MSTTPNTPRDESLTDEVFVEEHRTRELPAGETPDGSATPAPQAGAPTATMTATPASPSTTPSSSTAPATSTPTMPTTPAEPTYLRGPAPFAIVLGLLGLVVAGVTLVAELTDLSIPWDDLGPWTVVAAGLVVLLVGAIGLRASRPQD